ncbi:MAG: hypothetical protein K8E66_03150, partial [Phycisphaerales bacterium]|nr:hypothetical protein [Phycisphaerales bacterium]
MHALMSLAYAVPESLLGRSAASLLLVAIGAGASEAAAQCGNSDISGFAMDCVTLPGVLRDVAVADMDGNGIAEIIALLDNDEIRILTRSSPNGQQSVYSQQVIDALAINPVLSAHAIVVGSRDEDASIDIAVAESGSGVGCLTVFFQEKPGAFYPACFFGVQFDQFESLDLNDFDGDGDK